MTSVDPLALSFLLAAVETSHGIRVITSDPETLRRKLYQARRASGLRFIIQPGLNPNELWIRKPPDASQVRPSHHEEGDQFL